MSDNVFLGGNAAILQSIIDGTPYDAPIQSPIEELLIELKEVIEAGGGGGGGTSNYNLLTNKPSINGETLQGNLSGDALKVLTISTTMPEAVAALEGAQRLYVGATDVSFTKGLIYECQEVTPSTSPKTYTWVAISTAPIVIDSALSTTSRNPVQNKVVTDAISKRLIVSATLPAATSALEGETRLYIGTTTADYTKGLIYECQEVTPSTSPATYHWVAISAVSIEIDAALSTTSENPVQNKVVTAALNGKLTISDTMPAAVAALETEKRLYVGETTVSYIKGIIYECQEVTPSTTPKTYEWVAISTLPIEIDSVLSTTSENPVQNKIITAALNGKLEITKNMPEPSEDVAGKQMLYVGLTNSFWTKGCIYECQEELVSTDPETYSYEWVVINVNDITVDNALSSSSRNPVQNKVIWQYIYQQLYTTIANVQNNAKGAMELYSKNLNNIITSGFYNAMQCTNAPFDYMTLIVCGYYLDGYCLQIAMDVTTGAVRYRAEINEVWSAWDDLTQVDGVTITKDATTKQLSAAVATALAVGVMKPDGESTAVDANGNLSVINRVAVKDTMPTAAEELEGDVVIYVGPDTLTLTNGVIYECQEVTPATDPATYEWVAISKAVVDLSKYETSITVDDLDEWEAMTAAEKAFYKIVHTRDNAGVVDSFSYIDDVSALSVTGTGTATATFAGLVGAKEVIISGTYGIYADIKFEHISRAQQDFTFYYNSGGNFSDTYDKAGIITVNSTTGAVSLKVTNSASNAYAVSIESIAYR